MGDGGNDGWLLAARAGCWLTLAERWLLEHPDGSAV